MCDELVDSRATTDAVQILAIRGSLGSTVVHQTPESSLTRTGRFSRSDFQAA
jgi:hypothetical protein